MAWIKIPKEHHPLLLAALPRDPRVRTVQMFGATVGLVNGHMFGGLFARSAVVRLDPEAHAEAMALDGAEPFDPMGTKRVMADTVLLPESVMDEADELRAWLARAFAYTATLPPKHRKAASGSKASKASKVPTKHPKRPKRTRKRATSRR